jgi:8-oxo-dGTP pyrophosphatase MutT (NUDIX family)
MHEQATDGDEERRIIVIERNKPGEAPYYVFPGGGIDETDRNQQEALERELDEELGVTAEIAPEPFFRKGVEAFYAAQHNGGEFGTGDGPEFSRDPNVFGEYIIRALTLAELQALHATQAVKPPEAAEEVITQWPTL